MEQTSRRIEKTTMFFLITYVKILWPFIMYQTTVPLQEKYFKRKVKMLLESFPSQNNLSSDDAISNHLNSAT